MPSTLLLADDSVTIQRVIELTFADEDVKVVAVSDGDQAIARLDAAPPDIVLADVGMPGKTGYEVAQYVKQSPRLSHIPVVLLTGAFEPVDQARAAEAGCDGVLAKPFEPQLVIGRVRELLARSKGQAPAPQNFGEERLAPPPAPVSAPAEPADIANYFDRLDAAFANLSSAPAPAPETMSAAALKPFPDEPAPPAPEDAHVPEEIDWFGAAAAPQADMETAAAPDLPLSYGSPESAFEAQPAVLETQPAAFEPPAVDLAPPVASMEREASAERTVVPEPAPAVEPPPSFALPEKPVALPPLADAFAALLAAEQGDPSAVPAGWPAAAPSTDALVDQISRRVLDHVSARLDASVRDTVTDLVSELAERLIREEIERIKASIK